MLELPLRLRTLLSACPRGAPVICASADRCVVIVISLDYIAAGKNLRLRFRRATTEQAGKDEFRFDITKVVSDMHVIFAAGWRIMNTFPQPAAASLLLNILMQRRRVPRVCLALLRLRFVPLVA